MMWSSKAWLIVARFDDVEPCADPPKLEYQVSADHNQQNDNGAKNQRPACAMLL